jgi:hypothetical protein
MKRFALAALAAACLVATSAVAALADTAAAAASNIVTIPYGDYIQTALPFVGWAIGLAATYAMRHLPSSLVAVLKTSMAEQLFARAIDFALNAVAGATKGKKLDATIGNAVIAQAVQYILQYGPGWLVKWLGNEQGLRDRIVARLDLQPDVALMPVIAMNAGVQVVQQTLQQVAP